MEIEYRSIPEYRGYYIANNGSIWACKTGVWKQLKPTPNESGHLRVGLYKYGQRESFYVHILVLTVFVGPCPTGLECRHLDGNPYNNNLWNLIWGTRSQNCEDKVLHGTGNQGENHIGSKLTDERVIQIRSDTTHTQYELADIHDVTQSIISDIKHRKRWRHL